MIAETAGDGTALRDYIYQNGNLVAVKLHGIQAGVYYVISDHLGTPQQIVDSTGTVVWKAAYFPFGKAQILTETVTNNIRFPGQYFDAETGLHYNWNRYYDPETGRYLTPDPIGLAGGLNLYAYVAGDPVNWIDPLGLAPFTNNCDKAVCFKPESSKDGYDGTKKYECPPGRTCDADGVYPPDGSNPIKFCDGCSIKSSGEGDQCDIEKPDCPSWKAKLCQMVKGGQVDDDHFEKYPDWPKPSASVTPSPEKKQ